MKKSYIVLFILLTTLSLTILRCLDAKEVKASVTTTPVVYSGYRQDIKETQIDSNELDEYRQVNEYASDDEDSFKITSSNYKDVKEKLESIEFVKYTKFLSLLDEGKVDIVYLENSIYSIDKVYFKTIDEKYFKTDNPTYSDFKKELLEKGVEIKPYYELFQDGYFDDIDEKAKDSENNEEAVTGTTEILKLLFLQDRNIIVLTIVFLMLLVVYLRVSFKTKGIAGTNLAGFSSSGNVTTKDGKNVERTSFNDVAGLKEVKQDVLCLVDLIKNADKYKEMGAELPKGVVLYGPPGTGKTLIARAIAGEANVPFFFASGSEFVEMYVGLGAKRVRELFDKARKNSPCIVFIDEIDAIAGKRSHQDNSEDRKTLNQLLTEMDGFKSSDNILVIAATNRIEDLDSAILRPGRFTNKYCVPLPETASDRLEIINLYAKNKKFAEDVDFNRLAKETIGCSPADIESILNESAIICVQKKKMFIDSECIDDAFNKKVLQGHIKENTKERRREELELVAWHEAGHTVAGLLTGQEISKVTILASTSGAGGATFTVPNKMGLQSVKDLKNDVIRLYAGRCAEYLLFNDWEMTTTGASNDIERATNILYNMVSTLGMTPSTGMINLTSLNIDNKVIIDDVSKLAKELQDECLKLLEDNKDMLEEIVNSLMEKETVYEEELEAIKNKYIKKEVEA